MPQKLFLESEDVKSLPSLIPIRACSHVINGTVLGKVIIDDDILQVLCPGRFSLQERELLIKKWQNQPVEVLGVTSRIPEVYYTVDADLLFSNTPSSEYISIPSFFYSLITKTHPTLTIPDAFAFDGPEGIIRYINTQLNVFKARGSRIERIPLKTDTLINGCAYLRGAIQEVSTTGNILSEEFMEYFSVLEYPYRISDFTKLQSGSFVIKSVNPINDPVLTPPEFFETNAHLSTFRNGWCLDPPSAYEATPNREMFAAVSKHLEGLNIEISGLSLRTLAYYSDGSYALAKDYYPRDFTPYFTQYFVGSNGENQFPLLYCGLAWCITIHCPYHPDPFLHIYFATPELFLDAYRTACPEIAKDFEDNPWGDGFIFIASDWCQRNGSANYSKGIDLLTPRRRRCSLREWIYSDFGQRLLSTGRKTPWEMKIPQNYGYNPFEYNQKLEAIAKGQEYTPLWANKDNDEDEEDENEEDESEYEVDNNYYLPFTNYDDDYYDDDNYYDDDYDDSDDSDN